MTRFACFCPPLLSHVRAFEALGEALVERGHEVCLILNEGGAAYVRSPFVDVLEVASGGRTSDRFERGTGLFGILRTVREGAQRTEDLCRGALSLLREIGAEAILADQMEPAGALLAQAADLPFLSVAAALPIDPDPTIPSPFLAWPYDPSPDGVKRNRGGERVSRLLLRRQRETIRACCRFLGIPTHERMEDCLSPIGTLSQIVPGLDYPRLDPDRHWGLGSLRSRSDEDTGQLPFRRDPKRPLVFASLGTLQGHRLTIFQMIARACRLEGLQLAVAHCGRLSPREAAEIDADVVTDFLPQRAVLAEADLCVSHAGLNTVLDALEHGVPVLALPIAYDQPGVAARIVHHGAGLRLPHRRLTAEGVASALRRLLEEPSFERNAQRIGGEIREAGGASGAAAIIETALGLAVPQRLKHPQREEVLA